MQFSVSILIIFMTIVRYWVGFPLANRLHLVLYRYLFFLMFSKYGSAVMHDIVRYQGFVMSDIILNVACTLF